MAAKTETKIAKAPSGKIHLKLVRSAICTPEKQKLVVKGLGFTRLNQVIERPDNAAIRGMVKKVPHLVEVVGYQVVGVRSWTPGKFALSVFLSPST